MDYAEINKNSWNKKVDIHVNSDFYDNDNFLKGKSSLNKFELDLLGDLKGKSILHLQCHFGQDTISLARMGATATGIDLSDKAIDTARKFNEQLGTNAEFICCNIYDLPNHLDKTFDYVFTSYGTIGWLPDMNKWAEIVARYLKPGGQFVLVEFHPVVWMFDDNFEKITYKYSSPDPIIETYEGTYAQPDSDIKSEYVMWNHGIAEVVKNLLKHNLSIESMEEYDYSPYACFNNIVEFENGKYHIKNFGDKVPYVYSIVAKKSDI